ncbi:MAG: hypothetical protein V4450_08175 [Bacteroidota bacterium]
MYKSCICLLLLISMDTAVYPQNNGVVVGGKWADQVSITDVNGRPFANRFEDVTGTPYFLASYKYADMTLKQGRKFVQVKTKINLVTQETVFESSNGAEGYLEAGMVKEITFSDTTETGITAYKFQTGFPAVDRQSDKNFYQVFAEGKCGYFKSIVKKVIERKNELSGEAAKEFETTENYYLFVKGEMKRWKRNKESVLNELTDKQVQVNQFVLQNKTDFRNPEQVSKLLNYYNTL